MDEANPNNIPATAGTTSEETTPPPAPSLTGAGRIWARFKKTRGGKIGLTLVVAFTLVAFLAPFLAHRLPILWYDDAGQITWPLIREFFAPSDTTEPVLERGVNFLLLFIPLGYLAWRLIDKCLPVLKRKESRLISLLFGGLVAAALWLSIGGMIMDAGGKDWLYYEEAPVPALDDIANAFAVPVGVTGSPQGPLAAFAGVSLPETANDEDIRRAILPIIENAIDGPPLPAPSGDKPFDSLGLNADSLDTQVDRARWNRLVVEYHYPELLQPMRRFRGTFVAMVAVSALILLGLTYICLAGAWQFAVSPRWLALLVLAIILTLPFRHPARHNHAPYRTMAVTGHGSGVFPLIPYGPNEQGFGPRLPPSWYMPSAGFTEESVVSWTALEQSLDNSSFPGVARVNKLLSEEIPDWREEMKTAEGKARIVAGLNHLVNNREFYVEDAFAGLRSDANLAAYLNALRAGQELSSADTARMNRLVIEKALPGAFSTVTASRWKKPFHQTGTHVLGTDESGRDVLVRIIHGARVSLSVGLVSVFLATVIGLVMGSLAAYYGGKVDMLISRFLEIMMCFPSFFLILAVIAVLDKRSIINIMLVIGLTSWTGVARLIRGEMLRQKKMDYVSASVALGASDTRTIFRHILPNAMAPVLVSISFGITGAILTEASLSFIGFGVTPPTPTWGQLLSETRDSPLANWWLAIFPGIILFVSVLAYNLTGEALRDALDPRATTN